MVAAVLSSIPGRTAVIMGLSILLASTIAFVLVRRHDTDAAGAEQPAPA